MYEREYDGKTYTLEASGGLINSSLVMRDRETDSYWSLMKSEVIGGKLSGLKMKELPVSEKMRWRDWVAKYPNTEVLSVNGREDAFPVYEDYFSSPEGFRGSKAVDSRLPTKAPIFAFQWNGKAYAVPQSAVTNGAAYDLGGAWVFFFRPPNVEKFWSTDAYISEKNFVKRGVKWRSVGSKCVFNPQTGAFEPEGDAPCPEVLSGYDTFWYNWSLNHDEVILLGVK